MPGLACRANNFVRGVSLLRLRFFSAAGQLVFPFYSKAAETITMHFHCRRTLHAQKVVDIATGSGSKTTLCLLSLHSQMDFTTVHP